MISSGLKSPKTKEKIHEQVALSKYLYENMHLLGFDKGSRIINTVVRELLDNSLDACFEQGILPDITLSISPGSKPKTYKIRVTDNGPSIPAQRIPDIAGRMLYGSKFSASSPTRGQQGLGLTAIIMYGQKSTGTATTIVSKTLTERQATRCVLQLDIDRNLPKIISLTKEDSPLFPSGRGISIQLQVKATYTRQGVLSTPQLVKRYHYLNPCMRLRFQDPQVTLYERLTETMPLTGGSVGRTPHHQQVGDLQSLFWSDLHKETSILDLLTTCFYGSRESFQRVVQGSNLCPMMKAGQLSLNDMETLQSKLQSEFQTLEAPHGAVTLLHKAIQLSVTRNYQVHYDHVVSAVSKPMFFNAGVLQVQVCAFYGGPLPMDQKIQIQRVANCAPLTYQASGCAITRTVIDYNWKNYGLDQAQGQLPRGPLLILVHVAGSKVPYTSPSKDSIAETPLIMESIRNCLRTVGKSLRLYRSRQTLQKSRDQKLMVITKTIPQMIRVLEKGLKRKILSPSLRQTFAKIMGCLLVIEDGDQVQFLNGSTTETYEFMVGAPGLNPSLYQSVMVPPLDAKRSRVLPGYFIEGLNPLEYNVVPRKTWKNLQL